MLCSVPADITSRMQNTVWSKQIPLLLTSGTLSIGSSFHRFQDECGLSGNPRVTEAVAVSPFDYAANCRLFSAAATSFSEDERASPNCCPADSMPAASRKRTRPCSFTSYKDMSTVCECSTGSKAASQSSSCAGTTHRSCGNSAYPRSRPLGSGAAWEGMDFPGDCVSLLIIPRLPFAFPDAIHEHEKRNYPALRGFIGASSCRKCRSSSSRASDAPSVRRQTPAWSPS